MGFYKFLKNAGASLSGSGEKKSEEIKAHILNLLEKQGNKLEDLAVICEESSVTLSGKCDTGKTKEKAILIAGNLEGVEQVNGDGLEVPQTQTTTPAAPAASTPNEPQAPAAPKNRTVAAPAAPAASTTASAETQPALESQFYTIQKGDTLSAISKKFYGTANKYMYIVEENTGVIENADKIYPGQTIRIPPLKK